MTSPRKRVTLGKIDTLHKGWSWASISFPDVEVEFRGRPEWIAALDIEGMTLYAEILPSKPNPKRKGGA